MPEQIRVLHIIKSLGRGGAEMLLPETLKFHDKSRFQFHYIYFLPWKNQMVDSIREHGGIISCLEASNNIAILLKWRTVVRYIRENKIQLIHCHLPWAGLVGRIVHRVTGVPALYTEHNKQERYHFLTRWMNRLTFNWQSGAIAVSKDVAHSIKKNISVKIPVTEVVNGIDTESFRRDSVSGLETRHRLGIPADAFVLGTIAVFRFQKRLKEWLQVFARFSGKHPGAFAMVVGDGPLKAQLVHEVKALGMEKNVFMPGLQPEVKPWLSAMDVFMMTSEFEGLPLALLEAMSMECAIVTTDAGGIKEVITRSEEGSVVAVNEWMNLESELTQLMNDAPRRTAMGKAARLRVKESFSISTMAARLEECYVANLRD
jgi:glycosyltransferase involved in cell wall biosynthesis